MAIGGGYELATDAQFREVSNFTTPPRAGRITAIEGSGQVRVETDDPDGGDVLAWPLNGFSYAVNDVVYVIFAVNSPDSAIVIGSLAPVPTLDSDVLSAGYVRVDGTTPLTAEWDIGEDMAIRAERLEARDTEGLRLEDDGGNLAIFIEDGGQVGIGPNATAPSATLHARHDQNNSTRAQVENNNNNAAASAEMRVVSDGTGATFGKYSRSTSAYKIIGAGDAFFFNESTRGDYAFLNDYASGRIKMAAAGASINHLLIDTDGSVGGINGTGGWKFVTKSSVDNNAQTIIPNGTGDVVRGLWFLSIVMPSSGSVFMTANGIANNSNLDIYSSGANTLNLRVNADGSVDVRRTGGTLTYTVGLWLVWL